MAIPTSQGPLAVDVLEDINTAIGGYTVSDADGNQFQLQVTVSHGTLTIDPALVHLATFAPSGRGFYVGYRFESELNGILASLRYLPDKDYNGPDLLVIKTEDGSGKSIDSYVIDVKPVNDAPDIVSNGGFLSHKMYLEEGTTFVTKVVAVDVENDPITYRISGGADANLFNINAKTGKLTFKNAPDFSNPSDSNGDNFYRVTVKAGDGKASDSQDLIIGVVKSSSPQATNKAPVIVSDGGGDSAAISLAENTTAVTTVLATDENAGTKLKYSIAGGADAARFDIDALTGELVFKTAPNFEAPTDAGQDNVYDVVVKVSDGKLADTQALAVTVTDKEEAPVITSNGGGRSAFLYMQEGVTAVTTVKATDSDAGDVVTYSILGGEDAAKFTIDANTGALSFITPPSVANPTDANGDDVYQVMVGASDGKEFDYQTLSIAIDDTLGVIIFGTPGRDKVTAHKTVPGEPAPTEHGDIIAGRHNDDVLCGLGGDDIVFGGLGNDVLRGGKGNDLMIGGRGKNVVKGGSGADMFLFDWFPQAGKADKLPDFKPGVDTIALLHDFYPSLAAGPLGDDLFRIGRHARDDDDRLGYSKKNGKLWYDPDGVGGKKAAQIAKLDKHLDLHADDFLIV
ncbi:MAG: hypothetical protein KDJ88_16420 [Bauldia sp.]|nr:hypothetical protein [Bauldia sp.]